MSKPSTMDLETISRLVDERKRENAFLGLSRVPHPVIIEGADLTVALIFLKGIEKRLNKFRGHPDLDIPEMRAVLAETIEAIEKATGCSPEKKTDDT